MFHGEGVEFDAIEQTEPMTASSADGRGFCVMLAGVAEGGSQLVLSCMKLPGP